MSWNIRGNSTGPNPQQSRRVHGYTETKGVPLAICGVGYVLPPYRTDDLAKVTCRRCRAAMKI